MTKKVIRSATIVDPSQGIHEQLDLLIGDGQVLEIGRSLKVGDDTKTFDATGYYLCPGFIELHSHLREPGGEGSETIESGSLAAAKGGYTTVYCMPNTTPVCDSVTGVNFVLSRAAAVGHVKVIPVSAVTTGMGGGDLVNFGTLAEAGAGAFSDDGLPVLNAGVMRRALQYCSMLGMPIFDHCEDMDLTGVGVMNEGRVSMELGLKGIPRISESTIVARDIALAASAKAHLHICHVSARESVQAIREAKRSGINITAEASPHHLLLTDDAVRSYNTHAKMKPPLCEEEDRQALIAALQDGTIDCVATDHAPHGALKKECLFDDAAFGIIGMETAFPVLYTEFVATGKWTLDFLVEKMTLAPAQIMNKPWGTLKKGALADFNLIKLDEPYTFTHDHLGSKSRNCPWIGTEMKAAIAATFVEGDLRWQADRKDF
jgi:dihydroorotase